MSQIENLKDVLHDFKTPLTSILGYVELLKVNRDQKSRETFLNIIEEESKKILHMIDSFALERKSENDITDCKEIANSICREFRPIVQSKNISIQVDCEDNLKICFDKTDFWRVASNIVGNAIKYGKHDGFLKINIYREFDFVVWEFIDNGMGISEENLTNIFKKGFREKLAESQKGSGLGLYNVRNIISMNGGTITVQSKLGEGSKFTLRVRCAE